MRGSGGVCPGPGELRGTRNNNDYSSPLWSACIMELELRANTAPPPRSSDLSLFSTLMIIGTLHWVLWPGQRCFFSLIQLECFSNRAARMKGQERKVPNGTGHGNKTVPCPEATCPMSTLDIINHYSQLIYDAAKDTWRAANRRQPRHGGSDSFPQLFGHTLKIWSTFCGARRQQQWLLAAPGHSRVTSS